MKAIGIDTYGSVFKKYKELVSLIGTKSILTSQKVLGEDILPKNDFGAIDQFIKVKR